MNVLSAHKFDGWFLDLVRSTPWLREYYEMGFVAPIFLFTTFFLTWWLAKNDGRKT